MVPLRWSSRHIHPRWLRVASSTTGRQLTQHVIHSVMHSTQPCAQCCTRCGAVVVCHRGANRRVGARFCACERPLLTWHVLWRKLLHDTSQVLCTVLAGIQDRQSLKECCGSLRLLLGGLVREVRSNAVELKCMQATWRSRWACGARMMAGIWGHHAVLRTSVHDCCPSTWRVAGQPCCVAGMSAVVVAGLAWDAGLGALVPKLWNIARMSLSAHATAAQGLKFGWACEQGTWCHTHAADTATAEYCHHLRVWRMYVHMGCTKSGGRRTGRAWEALQLLQLLLRCRSSCKHSMHADKCLAPQQDCRYAGVMHPNHACAT